MKNFYHSQQYNKQGVLTDFLHSMNLLEIVSFVVFITMIASVVFISIWSSVLLITGKTQGGGPLGMIANVVIGIIN